MIYDMYGMMNIFCMIKYYIMIIYIFYFAINLRNSVELVKDSKNILRFPILEDRINSFKYNLKFN